MVFSSMLFLWVYLPIVIFGYHISGKKYKNFFLVLVSLLFYAWGEPKYILLMLFSILFNWKTGIWIEEAAKYKKCIFILNIICNMVLLAVFKYLDMFILSINNVCGDNKIAAVELPLPIGISFYTFQTMSYIIDLYRGKYKAQRSLISLALYISFFPQLIAGPIVRYEDINEQIENRKVTLEQTAAGIRRFIYGLGKKVIVSNILAESASQIADIYIMELTGMVAWVGAILYTLQIYYDFSGYSDMAIGLGKMFGFRFLENFNYPYLSKSISEFWRRWHISLGTWFREYLYIPLGGNRKGKIRTYLNLMIVFAVTGLWHGASWNFVVWGIYYGILNVIERIGLQKLLMKSKMFAWIYSILAVNFGWVIFQQKDLIKGIEYLKRMIQPWKYTESIYTLQELVSSRVWFVAIIAVLGCGGIQKLAEKWGIKGKWKDSIFEMLFCIGIVMCSFMLLAGNSYNPFIYFRF